MERPVTLAHLRGNIPEINGPFDRLRDEVRGIAKNEGEELEILEERVVKDFIDFHRRKDLQLWGKKKRRSGLTPPWNPDTNVTAMPKTKTKCPKRLFSEISNNEEKHGRPRKASGSRPPPTMPPEFKEKISEQQCYDVKMVIEKKLTNTDLSHHCSRLSIPQGQMRVDLLTKEDEENLEKRTEDRNQCKGMEVQLIEPKLNESRISLRRWKIGKTKSYILCNAWKKVAEDNDLKLDDTRQIWSFTVHDGNLGLALIKI